MRHDPFAAPNVDKATDIAMNNANPDEYFDVYAIANASALITSNGVRRVKYEILVNTYKIETVGIDIFDIAVTNEIKTNITIPTIC